MPLVQGQLAKSMKAFIKTLNNKTQEDADVAITLYCNEMEKDIYAAIKSITITIPSGMIQVAGPSGAMTNPAPIVLNEIVK